MRVDILKKHRSLILILWTNRLGRKNWGGPIKKYETVDRSRLNFYPENEKTKVLSSDFRWSRKDLFLKKEVTDEHFGKKWQEKYSLMNLMFATNL